MKKILDKNVLRNSIVIFLICLAVHSIEVIFIRTDETVFAECFINKVFGVALLFVLLGALKMTWRDIGFVKEKLVPNALKGIALCCVFYAAAFVVEFLLLAAKGTPGHMEFYVTGFSLTGNVVKQTGIGFVLMCIGFNIINVWMEEGLFRGFYMTYLRRERSKKAALLIAALLFGVWHLVTPLRSVLDGDMSPAAFAVMSIGYVALSAVMGVKWGILYNMSGTVWIGMADHFFNNCVVTNLLHVVTESGADEMQIVRVLIGELTSFFAVLIFSKLKDRKANRSGKTPDALSGRAFCSV